MCWNLRLPPVVVMYVVRWAKGELVLAAALRDAESREETGLAERLILRMTRLGNARLMDPAMRKSRNDCRGRRSRMTRGSSPESGLGDSLLARCEERVRVQAFESDLSEIGKALVSIRDACECAARGSRGTGL